MKLGATGEFPTGKFGNDDEGEIAVGVVSVPSTGKVLIDFGKPVKWLAMDPHQAKILGELIIKCAGELTSGTDEVLDWEKALAHFRAVRQTYQDLIATPGVNTRATLENVFRPISERYHRGERTRQLYDEMMAVR